MRSAKIDVTSILKVFDPFSPCQPYITSVTKSWIPPTDCDVIYGRPVVNISLVSTTGNHKLLLVKLQNCNVKFSANFCIFCDRFKISLNKYSFFQFQYIPGNLNLIITVPHGGYHELGRCPIRKDGN